MNIRIQRPGNKELIGIFPEAMREMERNYRSMQNDLSEYADRDLSGKEKEELKILTKYSDATSEMWLISKNICQALDTHQTPITDTNAFLLLLAGICAYYSNRMREMKRAALAILGEPYMIEKAGGQIDIVGNAFDQKPNSNLPELSYTYQGKPDKTIIEQRFLKAASVGIEKLLADRLKDDKRIKTLKENWSDNERAEFHDLHEEIRFIWHTTEKTDLLRHVLECLNSDDPPEIYQMFVCGLADFLEKVAAEYWHFEVKYNLVQGEKCD